MVINKKSDYINFFFPPFSEKELVSLFYLIFLSGIHHWKSIIDVAFQSGELFFFCLGAIAYVLLVFYYAGSLKKISDTEKQFFTYPFYVLLSLITLYSLRSLPDLNSASNRSGLFFDLLEIFEFLIIIYLFLKSFLQILIMRFAPNETSRQIAKQMQDEQLRSVELILIILFAPVIYLQLQANNSISQVLCLSYFYLITIITFSNKVIKKISFSKKIN